VIRVVAPASTANLGPAFDSAAAALDLWNELVVDDGPFRIEIEGEGADELPRDGTHLAVRAFSIFRSPAEHTFRFVNRIPLERGLGSSAAAIALGLVAGAAAAGRPATADELLAAGEHLEGHADNLAAVLNGGVCFSWRRNGSSTARRVAPDMPAVPVVAVPPDRTRTDLSRSALPLTIRHEDAAVNAGAAALLGAAIASGDSAMLGDAFRDRLHEQYRLDGSPLLRDLRHDVPAGAVGVTLSGSGPSVVVWAEKGSADAVAARLVDVLPAGTTVLPLRVTQEGARVV
jgi:homoserine kinase